jgi:hypothetical protein
VQLNPWLTLRAGRCYTPPAMRVALAVGLGIALVGSVRTRAEDAAPPTTSTTRPPLEQTTTVDGTAPAIEGRWLVLASVGIGQSAKRVIPSVLDISTKDGTLEVRERHVVLPPAQNEAVKRGNDELGGVWSPGPADVAAIAAAWDTLEPEDRGIATMQHQVTGRDAFDDDLRKEDVSKDALWVLRQSYVFLPGGSRPVNQANLLAPVKHENGVYSGGYIAVAVAAAPFPVPIKFDGTFQMIPIARAAPSFWTRLGDFFAGCNRR